MEGKDIYLVANRERAGSAQHKIAGPDIKPIIVNRIVGLILIRF